MLKKIIKNDFTRKVIALSSGSILVSMIGFIGFFIVAKLYSVDVLGYYYMVLSYATVLTSFASFGYIQAIPLLDKTEENTMFSTIILFSLCVILFLGILMFNYVDFTLYIVSFSLLNIYTNLIEQFFIREQLVKNLNVIRLGKVVTTMSVSIVSFFIFGDNLNFLIVSLIIFSFLFNVLITAVYFAIIPKFHINANEAYTILKKYIRFPKFIGPGMIFHTIAYQIPILVAGNYFSPAIAAYYNMAFKLVYTPASLISGSISQVYLGQLSKMRREGENIFNSTRKLVICLGSIAITYIVSVKLFLPIIVESLFDNKWMDSIPISMALLPLIFALVAIAPLSNIFQFTNNQKYIFKVHLFSMLIAVLSFTLAVYRDSFILGVSTFAVLMFVRYVFLAFKIYTLKKSEQI